MESSQTSPAANTISPPSRPHNLPSRPQDGRHTGRKYNQAILAAGTAAALVPWPPSAHSRRAAASQHRPSAPHRPRRQRSSRLGGSGLYRPGRDVAEALGELPEPVDIGEVSGQADRSPRPGRSWPLPAPGRRPPRAPPRTGSRPWQSTSASAPRTPSGSRKPCTRTASQPPHRQAANAVNPALQTSDLYPP